MSTTRSRIVVLCLGLALVFVPWTSTGNPLDEKEEQAGTESRSEESSLKIYFLEIVTPAVQETCDALEKVHGVTFGEAVAEFGNARTASLKGGGLISVRAPMRSTEEPVVRPYVLVEDIHAAVGAAEKAGAQVALPPIEIPGQGTFAIYILGGIEHGLWQIK